MPIEADEAVVGMKRVSETTLPVLRTLGQHLSCGQSQSAVHESADDVMDESRGLRMNNLLSLLLFPFPLRLLLQPMFCRLRLPL